MGKMKKPSHLGPALVLLLVAAIAKLNAQSPDLVRFRAASDNTSLDTPGSLPWHLKLEVTLTPGTAVALTGTVEEWWTDPTHFRIDFDLPAYKATHAQAGDQTYRTPGAESAPYLLRSLLDQTVHPIDLPADLGASHAVMARKLFGKTTLDCMGLSSPVSNSPEPHRGSESFCLAPDKTDLYITVRSSDYIARTKLGTFRSKQVPVDLVVRHADVVGATAHLALLTGRSEPYEEAGDLHGLETNPRIPTLATSGIIGGKLIKSFPPVYPLYLKEQQVSGQVLLDVVIGPDGHVHSAAAIYATHPLFVDASIDAVKQWVYSPALLNGVPVAMETAVTVNFVRR